jgi:hypothetical protein
MSVFQTAYFPSLAYVRALAHDTAPIIEIYEHFVKQSIRTRCEILTANGVLQLNVPIIHESGKKLVLKDCQIDYSKNWISDHWRAIESAYANAPHFEHYAHDLEAIYRQKPRTLLELNSLIWSWLAACLGFEPQLKYSSTYLGESSTDKKEWLGRNIDATKEYLQLFESPGLFVSNLSILDGLFNEGPLLRKHFLPFHLQDDGVQDRTVG